MMNYRGNGVQQDFFWKQGFSQLGLMRKFGVGIRKE
jgi:hypothetical protein